jgi:CDP-glucose 4,6-dehydratase
VLSPLSGYVRLAQELAVDPERRAARAWNFGPPAGDEQTVGQVIELLQDLWRGELKWQRDEGENPPEASHLALDSSAAEELLGWRPAWSLEDSLELAVDWHRAQRDVQDMRTVSLEQISRL